jgi:DNA modification methylase
MPKFNDLDLSQWKTSDVFTDSLWIINERDKSGKHSNFYHGNFVPQIPHQLILRYSKENDIVFDPFLGSGTTAYECETLKRNFVGVEIQSELASQVQNYLDKTDKISKVFCGDSTKKETFEEINTFLQDKTQNKVQLAILHPPYADIVKFSSLENDLSNIKSLKEFLESFSLVLQNTKDIMKKEGYLAIVIGDKYSKGQWIPLGFYCMYEAQKLRMTLKSVVVKNMEGNRAKMNKEGIWRCLKNIFNNLTFGYQYA